MAAKGRKLAKAQGALPSRIGWHTAKKLSPTQETIREKWRSSTIKDDQAALMQLGALEAEATRDLAENFETRPAMLIPYFKPDGTRSQFFRIRYMGQGTGWSAVQAKPQRYAQPKGSVNEVYLPPYADDPSWWETAGANPGIPMFFTEGELKAAAMCAIGFPTGGFGGVDMVGSSKKGIELFYPLDTFVWQGRDVTILFDSDGLENPDVQAAQIRAAKKFTLLGAIVRFGFIPPAADGGKQGADDWILAAQGEPDATPDSVKEAFEAQILDAAIPHEEGVALHDFNSIAAVIDKYNQVLRRSDGRVLPIQGAQLAFAPYRHRIPVGEKYKQVSTLDEWLKWKHRFTLSDICYTPGRAEIYDGRYNVWRPSKVVPIPLPDNACPPWWDWLLDRCLFDGAPAARAWVEQWCAYPLQNPGVKMATALALVSQVEGIGKTLFADTVGSLYEHNYITIGDAELDSAFNAWMARKQFICGNEVSGRRKAALAKLRGLITDRFVEINEKYLPGITFDNCANFVFTTNDLEVFGITDNDRRIYLHEINTKPRPPAEYRDFAKWAKSEQGKGELLSYLLHLPIVDFQPFARAPDSAGRQAMIAEVRPIADEALFDLLNNLRPALKSRFGAAAGAHCDLWTPDELYQCVPESRREGVTFSAFCRAFKRFPAQILKVNGGAGVRVGEATLRLVAVDNFKKYTACQPVKLSDHRESKGPRSLTPTHS